MDPVLKLWYYYNWIADQEDKYELAKNHAYLSGSFVNPEAVKSLSEAKKIYSTDEDFDESTKIVEQYRGISLDKKKRRIRPKR